MKVYIARYSVSEYDESFIYGVFDSREKAENALLDMIEEEEGLRFPCLDAYEINDPFFDYVGIEVYELNQKEG